MTRPAARPGFTLVELLLVMALIATLVAVTVGAVFRVRSEQNKKFTAATVQKVDSLLLQKLKTIQEKIKDYRKTNPQIYTNAQVMAGGINQELTDAILMYAHTRNELPMTFAEAKANTTVTINGQTIFLQASPVFAGLPNGTGAPEESAVCLYLALSQLGNNGLEQQIGDAPNLPGFKCYVDAYGQPLYFNRLAFGGDNGELDNPPFVRAPVAANTFDPFYPKPQPTGGYRNLATDLGVANANILWQAVLPPNTTYTAANNWANIPGINAAAPFYVYPNPPRNHTATIISSGPDKDLTSPPGLFAGDNIVSYRLRQDGGRGD